MEPTLASEPSDTEPLDTEATDTEPSDTEPLNTEPPEAVAAATTSDSLDPDLRGDPAVARGQVALDRLLDGELQFSPRATGHFISHLAMGLVAAHRLGADDDTLEAWYRADVASGYLVPRDVPAWLGPDTARVAERGVAATVSEQLPALVDAPSSQFFHAMIRLDLAVDAGHPGQVANALQNWASDNMPIAPLPTGTGGSSFAEVLSLLADESVYPTDGPPAFGQVASGPAFVRALETLKCHDRLLDEVMEAAVSRHIDPRDFGTLHLVTGTRAARAMVGFLDRADAERLALRTAQAVAAALSRFGHLAAPPTDTSTGTSTSSGPGELDPDWELIERRAVESADAHIAKLVYACKLEDQITGHPIYRAVAARQTGL